MIRRTLICFLLLSCFCVFCHAQALYKGLEPGKSNRSDVMNVLGAPVRDVSEVLSEYKGSGNEAKIYVQYMNPSGIIARIEILLVQSMSLPEAKQMVGLHAPPAFSNQDSKGRLVEYYGGKNIVLTHESAESESSIVRTAYYSKELFQSVASNPADENGGKQTTPPPAVTTSTTTPTTQSKGSHTLTISDLQAKKQDQSIEFTFKFFDQAGDVDPDKGRVIIPLRILCGTDAGINITWSAMAVEKQDQQHGLVHVPVFTQLFPSGQDNNCEITISLQDLAGNTSNELKIRMKI